jgi:hypothetical protein
VDILGSLHFLPLLKSRIYRITREIREGLPLLTVETEGNGDSKSTNERGCPACPAGTRDYCSALAALVGPVQNINRTFFFSFFVPIPQPAGHAAVLGRLSLSVCV